QPTISVPAGAISCTRTPSAYAGPLFVTVITYSTTVRGTEPRCSVSFDVLDTSTSAPWTDVNVTSSKTSQSPSDTVHRRVTDVLGNNVIVALGSVRSTNSAGCSAETTDHKPVPSVGTFASSVKIPVWNFVWS